MADSVTNSLIGTTMPTSLGQISENMFGAIGVNSFGWNYFQEHTSEFNLSNIRWPGGTISETGWVKNGLIRVSGGEISLRTLAGDRSNFAFDLTHPELISDLALAYDDANFQHRDDIGTFSQALALAVERGVDLELIIPTKRYYTNEDLSVEDVRNEAIAAAVDDISVFLDRLVDGQYNNGQYPEKIIFDIGNEQYSNPIAAAIIGKAVIDTIADRLEGTDIDFDISFQMGRGEFEYDNLFRAGYFNPFFDGGAPVPGLEDVKFSPGQNVPNLQQNTFIERLMTSVLGDSLAHVGSLRHHVLGLSAPDLEGENAPLWRRAEIVEFWYDAYRNLGIDPTDIEYNISAFSTDTSNGNSLPYELPGATNLLEFYDYAMQMGVDRASIWGVVGAFRYKDDISTTTVTDRLSNYDTPQATMLRLMSQNVVDSDYIGASGGRDDGYRTFTYVNQSEYTVLIYVEDVNNGEYRLDVDLGLLGDVGSVLATHVDIRNGGTHGAADVTSLEVELVDGVVQLTFDQDFEIVMLTVDKSDSIVYQVAQQIEAISGTSVSRGDSSLSVFGDETSEQIAGGIGSDFLFGMQGNDTLTGGAGRGGFLTGNVNSTNFDAIGGNQGDFIFGGEGDDNLYGMAGNDLLSGGEGDDQLWGGGGFDTFVFNSGKDVIRDFDSSVDSILIHTQLFGEEQTLDDWLGEHSSSSSDGLTIDFGMGNELTINNVTDVAEILRSIQLSDDLDFLL